MKPCRKLFPTLLLFSFFLIFPQTEVNAASITNVVPGKPGAGNAVTTSCDITGDGIPETIRTYYTWKDGYTDYFYIDVDGSNALSLNMADHLCFAPFVNIVVSNPENICIQILCHTDNDYTAFNQLFQYDASAKQFSPLLDLHSGVTKACENVTAATDTGFIVKNHYQPPEIGWISWNYTYTWQNGIPVLVSDQNTVTSAVFKNKKFTTERTLTFYKTPGGKKKAFKLKPGKKVKLKYIKVTSNRMYAGFKYGKKTGWLRIDNSYEKVYKYNRKSGTTKGYFKKVYMHLAG